MRLLFSLAVLSLLTPFSYGQLVLNEIQSSNANIIADEFGDYDDWIEIRNLGTEAVNLAGYVLKDNVDIWPIPDGGDETTVQPGGYILFWCDDEEETQGVLHTNFKLSAANGEYLGLYEADSVTVIDETNFPPMGDNIVFQRCEGDEVWIVHNVPTPLAVNDCPNSISEIQFSAFFQNGLLNFHSSAALERIRIFDLNGKLVLDYSVNSEGHVEIPFEYNGAVLVHATTANGHWSKVILHARN